METEQNKKDFKKSEFFLEIRFISFHTETSSLFLKTQFIGKLKQLQTTKVSGPFQLIWRCCEI